MCPIQLSLGLGVVDFLSLGSEEREWLQVPVGGRVQAEQVFLKRQGSPEKEPLVCGRVSSPSFKVQKHSRDLTPEATATSRVASGECDMPSQSLSPPPVNGRHEQLGVKG